MFPPDRIICLTEETVETLYLLGEHDCIVGISGYVVRPPPELIEIAGGIDIFADRKNQGAAKNRIVRMEEVVERAPDLIIGSWCGKKFRPERVAARPGFAQIPAVQHQHVTR